MNQKLVQMLRASKRPLVLAHESPDGDALGSVLGLVHLLKGQGITALGYREGLLPDEFGFLPGVDELLTAMPPADQVDLAVLLDCHEPKRTGREAEAFLNSLSAPAVVVDHHRGTADFGRESWVDAGYAATCEMIAELAREAGLEVSPQAATCLYTGILTDTGSFAHANTSPGVLRAAARLVEAGAAPWEIHGEVFATRPVRLFLFSRMLEKAELHCAGRLIVATVSQADLEALSAKPYDLENAVESLRGIPGVRVAALIKERGDGGVKVSMRSKGELDVARVALELGGGGHKNAAGCRLEMNLAQAAEKMAALLCALVEGV